MSQNSKKKICFIGVGNMGNPMARNLIRAGHELLIYDLDRGKTEDLISLGACLVTSLATAVSQCDLIISSLPGPPQVKEVFFGIEGIIKYAKPGTTIIDTSTSSSDLAVQIEMACNKGEINYLEAPITNAVDGAKRGELAFFIAGQKSVFEDHKDIFLTLGTDLFFVGKPGNGNITKLITNLLWFVSAAAVGEALMLGAKAEIPLETIWDALKSSAGNSWVVEHDIPSVFAGHYDPSFSLELCCKDLGLVNTLAKVQGFELSMGAKAQEVFTEAKEKYGPDAPELSVVRLLEEKLSTLLRPNEKNLKEDSYSIPQIDLMKEAHQHMPQGVAENYRYWGDDKTVFVKKSKGCHLVDSDDKTYIDFRLGYGPIILGYGDQRVDQAVIKQISEGGTLSGFSTGLDTEVVKKIKEMCPNIEKMRFANSGTEAVMGAIRTARGFTQRDEILVVEGGFHGLFDEVMWKSSVEEWNPETQESPDIIPFGGGIPESANQLVTMIPLNNLDKLQEAFEEKGESFACVLLEPIIGNCGSISSSKSWLEKLRELCTEYGTVLIMDEVKTGFRVAKGGAQELYGIHADLTTYAKAMGNGYPIAAFGGKKEIMDVIGSHSGAVVHGGTYTANLIGLAAAKATLDILQRTNALETINNVGLKIQHALGNVFTEAGIQHHFAGPASMFGIHFSDSVPTNYRDWRVTDSSLYEAFAWNLIEGGIMLEPDSREPWFICEAHRDIDFQHFELIVKDALMKAIETHSLKC